MQEEFFSVANVSWFLLGIAAEFCFMGYGITTDGMALSTQIATSLGMIDPVATVAGGATDMVTEAGVEALAM